MSTLGLLVVVLIFSSITLFVISLSYLFKKEKKINKFTPYWDEQEEEHIEYEKKKRKLSPLLILLVMFGGITGFGIVFIVTGVFKIALIGFAVGFLIPSIWGKYHANKRMNLILLQLEQAAEVMASVLRSGSGIVEALDKASLSVSNPLRNELITTANEIKLGISSAVAIKNLYERINVDELGLFSMGMNLSEQGVAVNLSGLLEQIRDSIRYKLYSKRQMRVITASNRLACWIVSALPYATLFIIRLMMPDLIAPLFNTTIGIVIFTICSVLIVIGIIWLMKIANMDF